MAIVLLSLAPALSLTIRAAMTRRGNPTEGLKPPLCLAHRVSSNFHNEGFGERLPIAERNGIVLCFRSRFDAPFDWEQRGERLRWLYGIALVLLVAAASLASATQTKAGFCTLPDEHSALEARILQIELMVAALTCGEHERYNAFVKKFRRELVERGHTLRHLFQRAYPGADERELNRFVTRLANQASERSLAGWRSYCSKAWWLFSEALATNPQAFEAFLTAHPFNDRHGFESCQKEASTEPQPTARD